MARRLPFALGLAIASSVLRSGTGCSKSDGGGAANIDCHAGCLCFPVDACPAGCYASQTEQPDGSASSFCSNGLVDCVASGTAWSVGTPVGNCVRGAPISLSGGRAPKGALCCSTEPDVATEAGDDFQAAGACAAAGGQCVFGGCSNPGPQSCETAGMFCCLTGLPDASTDAAE